MKIKYRRCGYNYAYELPGDWEADDEFNEIVEAAAHDYWINYDGFEARWPITFEILMHDGGLIAIAEVEMDIEPVFTANILPLPKPPRPDTGT